MACPQPETARLLFQHICPNQQLSVSVVLPLKLVANLRDHSVVNYVVDDHSLWDCPQDVRDSILTDLKNVEGNLGTVCHQMMFDPDDCDGGMLYMCNVREHLVDQLEKKYMNDMPTNLMEQQKHTQQVVRHVCQLQVEDHLKKTPNDQLIQQLKENHHPVYSHLFVPRCVIDVLPSGPYDKVVTLVGTTL